MREDESAPGSATATVEAPAVTREPRAPPENEFREPVSPDGPLPALRRLQQAIGRCVVGYEDAVHALAVALLAEGHVLLEGVPGLAKTYLVRMFARSLDLTFRRIQFTPDMLPSDIVGVVVLNPKVQTFEYRRGPVFTNVLLADEINRAPPKVQSALLEAMQERQVTVDGVTYPLPRPFMVIATQNPIEHEGTYPLPEAELDRFLLRWLLDYPAEATEVNILRTRLRAAEGETGPPVVAAPEVDALRRAQEAVFVHDDIYQYIARLVRETRTDERVLMGASPRAGVHFLAAARALARLDERGYVIPDDVRALAFPVLNHRVLLRPEVVHRAGERGARSAVGPLRSVIHSVLDRVEVPR